MNFSFAILMLANKYSGNMLSVYVSCKCHLLALLSKILSNLSITNDKDYSLAFSMGVKIN